MLNTPRNILPLLAASQAQKHVTVNESLVRLDALTQISVKSRSLSNAPVANDGDCYLVADSPTGEWTNQANALAIFHNSGWIFLNPVSGWIVFVEDEATVILWSEERWRILQTPQSSVAGATTTSNIIEFEHVISGGSASETTQIFIPANTIVLGVTGRVSETITTTTGIAWRLGVTGSDNRYGAGLGLSLNSTALGLTGQPLVYFYDTNLLLTCDGGTFTSGKVILAVHCQNILPPAAI